MSTAPSEQQTPPQDVTPAVPVPRPEGVSDAEWAALGDPGKAALVRERSARSQAEQALTIARTAAATPAPPPPPPPPTAPKKAGEPADETPDIAAIVQRAVAAAIAPMQEAAAQREAEQAAAAIHEVVTLAAADRFHDPSDALTGITLSALTDGAGKADPAKVSAALDDLLTRKPHLGKPFDARRRAVPGGFVGAGNPASGSTLEDRVKRQLELMSQQH